MSFTNDFGMIDFSLWTMGQILADVIERGLDPTDLVSEDIEEYEDEYRNGAQLIRELRKLYQNRIHAANNPKPKARKRAYVQRTKGRTAEAIVKGMR